MKKTISYALACASLLTAAAAQAQFTVGGSIGQSKYKGDEVGGLSTDRSDTGGKVYGGYQFTPNFGLELGHAKLGSFGSAAGDVKASGTFVDAVGTMPLGGNFSLLGRVGAFNGKLENSFAGDTDKGTNVKVGAGVQYDFSNNLGVRGEWERYRFDATGGGKANTDMYSVGLNYRF